ncbi:hypothetical protein MTR67_048222 [Solanum verrucosum]|uniref:Gag-pol polyprotein n=1 Tax=Solanum verrucosum TaxID=315347 RepID=A0AAF0UYH3_SOLVR|nr:hypothetical protein MTR67_048222 [Solanum verrucosum]
MQRGKEVTRQDKRAQCYAFSGKTEAEVSNTMITCTILVCDRMPTVLFDLGSTYSYVSVQFTLGFDMTRKLVGQGCLVYLAHIRDVEVESPSIEYNRVVSKFTEVFLTDLPGIPPDRDIDFCIDLESGIRPISIPPYTWLQ